MTFKPRKSTDLPIEQLFKSEDRFGEDLPSGRVQYVKISEVTMFNGRRPVSMRKVKALCTAIKEQGLLHPIVVYRLNGTAKGQFGLSAGAHRLAACKRLKMHTIPATIVDRAQAKIIASSENLHRNDLTILRRSEEIMRYAASTSDASKAKKKRGGRQPNDKRISELARRIGHSREIVTDAFRHAGITAEARKLLTERRLENKRAILNRIANQPSEKKQIALIDEVAPPPKKGIPPRKAKSPKSREPSIKLVKPASELMALSALWKNSGLKRLFEKQLPIVKQKFIRRISS